MLLGLTATGWTDVHDGERRSHGRIGVWLDVAPPPRPPGGAGGLLQVRREDAAATACARRLLGRAEADWRAETVNLRPPSPRESLPPCSEDEGE